MICLMGCPSAESGPTMPPADAPVATIEITPNSATFNALGDTRQFVALAKDAAGQTVSDVSFAWGSSDPAVVSVAPSGIAEANGNGRINSTSNFVGIAIH